jgi:2-oxoisovalerate dehydrogenase E1 component alpha subunit
MVMARAIERRVWTLNRTAGLDAQVRVGGCEVVQVAAAAALRPGLDWIVPFPRDLALCLAAGLSPLDVMLALLGRDSDPSSGGRQTPGDFGLRRARIASTSGLAGVQVVHAAGIAYASKLRGEDEVTLVSTGERGTDSGDWHEGLNFASVHRLPMICLVQDGGFRAQGVPGRRESDLIARRAQGYGMADESVDGTDFDAAFEAFTRAVERARSGEGPTLVHARVIDLTSLTAKGARQPQERLEATARRDPIDRMQRKLHDSNVLDDEADDRVQRDCISVVEAAFEQARAAPAPEPAAALENVFGVRQ